MQENIFIGSSVESKSIAIAICSELKKHDLKPHPWWEESPQGTITLERLIKLSNEVQGAVFVFGNDDARLYRGSKISTAHDNIILTWGIFLSQLGVKKCIVFCSQGVRPPIDLAGFKYVDGSDASATTKLSQYLKTELQSESPPGTGDILIASDTHLGLMQMYGDCNSDHDRVPELEGQDYHKPHHL